MHNHRVSHVADDAAVAPLATPGGGSGGQANYTKDMESAAVAPANDTEGAFNKTKQALRARLGEDVFTSWFQHMEFERFEAGTVHVSVPVKFLKTWIQSHYTEELLICCRGEFKDVERVEVSHRQPGGAQLRGQVPGAADRAPGTEAQEARGRTDFRRTAVLKNAPQAAPGRTQYDGFEGSPLDPRYTFDSFVVGAANRLGHAAAKQVSETVLEERVRFNPLFIHSSVGLGKTHLLHAIAWDVKRRSPHAQILYLTAEHFRYRFVEALRSQEGLAFKDKFRGLDMLLIDDLEFLHGDKTNLEFDATINALLDGGKPVVVASARAPVHLESLDARMRSRLAGGLVVEVAALDHELRLKILEKRMAEKRAIDPTFEINRDVLELMADRLTESGRELEGAIMRLYAHSQITGQPITVEFAEGLLRDLTHGAEARRIKIEDILRVVSKHFGVSRTDILSERRHRSIVWPRQIGMYLAKQLTSRSLPEIGRRFGGRDHTTVLHAIRKIEGVLGKDQKLRTEIEDLKRMLNG